KDESALPNGRASVASDAHRERVGTRRGAAPGVDEHQARLSRNDLRLRDLRIDSPCRLKRGFARPLLHQKQLERGALDAPAGTLTQAAPEPSRLRIGDA